MATATTRDGVKIAYDDLGVGEPALLCLPGWCSTRLQFAPVAGDLSTRRRTLVLDWRGHGASSAPAGDFGHEQMVDDALAVLEASGAEHVVPVAAAHAGWVAIELRRRLGERIAGFVSLSWMLFGAPPPFLQGLQRMQQPDGWAEVRDQLFQMWRGGSDDTGVGRQLADMASFGGETWRRAGREIEAAYRQQGAPVDQLSRLQPPMPVLHLYAQPADGEILQGQQRFAAEHEWFSVRRMDAETHFPQFEQPEETVRLIEEFVAKL